MNTLKQILVYAGVQGAVFALVIGAMMLPLLFDGREVPEQLVVIYMIAFWSTIGVGWVLFPVCTILAIRRRAGGIRFQNAVATFAIAAMIDLGVVASAIVIWSSLARGISGAGP